MNAEIFASLLREIDTKTPLTDAFEQELNDDGIRKYAQKEDRWWDGSTGTQKEHVICWFARKEYEEGSTETCIESNYIKKCRVCYFFQNPSERISVGQEKDAKKVFAKMQRPEMFLYIAESLGVLDKETLRCCINDVKAAMDKNPRKWKDTINNYITWEKVEYRINNSN